MQILEAYFLWFSARVGNKNMTMTSALLDYSETNDIKANFDRIYIQGDPREYYRVLYGLDYVIPDLAKGIFRDVIAALSEQRKRSIKVLDLGCSYGNNAALIRFPLDIDRLAARYRDLEDANLSTEELTKLDRNYFKSWPKTEIEIVGLDVSEPALNYAKDVGLLDDAIALDLENGTLTDAARAALSDVDLIISTGCIGYVTEKTYSQVLGAIEGPMPWVASFVLRMFPYTPIGDLLEREGLVTEKLEGVSFVQRRFLSANECSEVLQQLHDQDIDTTDKEAKGLLHAEFYLSRPDAARKAYPLEQLVSVTSGADRNYGRRFTRKGADLIRFGR
jgi:SAM-dependent methyltransferase